MRTMYSFSVLVVALTWVRLAVLKPIGEWLSGSLLGAFEESAKVSTESSRAFFEISISGLRCIPRPRYEESNRILLLPSEHRAWLV